MNRPIATRINRPCGATSASRNARMIPLNGSHTAFQAIVTLSSRDYRLPTVLRVDEGKAEVE